MTGGVWDTDAVLDHVLTLLTATAEVQNVQKGAPPSWTNRVTVYASVGPQVVEDRATNDLLTRQVSVFVEWGYRVAGAVPDAEETLARYLDEFLIRLFDSRNNHEFGGVGTHVRWDLGLSANPDYLKVAGQELRTYPMLIWVTQRENLSTLVAAL